MSNSDFVQDTVEQLFPVPAGESTGALDGAWGALTNYDRAGVLLSVDGASEELTITLEQATDGAGAGAKTLNVGRVYLKDAANTTFSLVNEAKAASYALPAASGISTVVVEVENVDLDINNDFAFFRARISGSTARTQALTYLMRGPRYKGAQKLNPLTVNGA